MSTPTRLDRWRMATPELIDEIERRDDVITALLTEAYSLHDSQEWRWRCRHCRRWGKGVNLRHELGAPDIEHEEGCIVAVAERMAER